MEVFRTRAALANYLSDKADIGFVPTMGALHAGHLSLVSRAVRENLTVVVSIFLNPTQFNDPNDLQRYPRTEDADLALLEPTGCSAVFCPSVEEMYPTPDTRQFALGQVAEVMEGRFRPGHFNGVAQVVSRLFDIIQPRRAYFGEKDFQQIAVIRSMVALLGYSVEIIPCPIVRSKDGLALSSRNALLSTEERFVAPKIYATLQESLSLSSTRSISEVHDFVVSSIESFSHLLKVEYFEIVDGLSLRSLHEWSESSYIVGCITVFCGKIRLIDHITYTR